MDDARDYAEERYNETHADAAPEMNPYYRFTAIHNATGMAHTSTDYPERIECYREMVRWLDAQPTGDYSYHIEPVTL